MHRAHDCSTDEPIFFQGVGWLGASFASGALAAVVFAVVVDQGKGFLLLVADALILLAFVLLHVCFLELSESESIVPRLVSHCSSRKC